MKIDILTIFPDMFKGPFDTSMLKKAKDDNLVEINIHDLRAWSKDTHKTVDDRPYGGGPGMIIRVDIVDRAISNFQFPISKKEKGRIILLSAKGKIFTQKKALEYSKLDQLILIAGHYEGVDERVAEHLADEEVSIGEYVLTGGELPAMVLVDTVVRLIPGVLGNPQSLSEESFSPITNHQPAKLTKLRLSLITSTEYPQYTRPENYKEWKVPDVLLSGNHKEIEKWKVEHARKSTRKK
ncbi:tRNA (guanosine(37)-N1)-methyltransferase TrmD [Candidatus Woesebacteria bacterium RIFCSPLOWO2_01_FULL_39_10]|uniref:tRNA (guanine-N(1)-)-methyltransferase n=1 Tax=Candidatus Woesebacteria bacterium RIFCSPLOWO2_01_FULL_39_10 TaxID=1802516 RepID=A0A1F8B7T2_9BACT|nr:MAG: tRNA (guanosine(37)-N1)-methyltransferase TrmD [Candidatus Woesebacteria bacterium RIFCSPLOWO2_01_FULL_39_10]